MTPGSGSDRLSHLSTSPEAVDARELADALQLLADQYYRTRQHVAMQGVRGAPDWRGFETALWQLGQKVGQFLKARRDLRGDSPVLDSVATIVREEKFGKGRQIFVSILGDFGSLKYADDLKSMLRDPNINGHVIRALLKLRVPGCVEPVRQILADSKTGWIRTAAKRYLQQLGR